VPLFPSLDQGLIVMTAYADEFRSCSPPHQNRRFDALGLQLDIGEANPERPARSDAIDLDAHLREYTSR
jgi:hypothetical protein